MKATLAMLVLLFCFSSAEAQGRRGRWVPQQQWQPSTSFSTEVGRPINPAPYVGTNSECKDALDEVNATRAQRGLRPYINDPLLAQGALACARVRAQQHNAGHTSNDFAYLPSGAQATVGGCAAWTPDWGWGACATYDNYTYCGAAWVLGSDGRRYMHLFCR
mgnify:CR=1 FL=1